MNGSQLHLALNHVPVILTIVASVILVIALIKRNDMLSKTAFYLLFFAGLAAVPVFFSGEDAEEIVEKLPGVSESVIEEHETLAKAAFGVVIAAAIISLAGLMFYHKTIMSKFIRPLVLLLALATSVIMSVTAHLGGQVRHTEIRSGFPTTTQNGSEKELPNNENEASD